MRADRLSAGDRPLRRSQPVGDGFTCQLNCPGCLAHSSSGRGFHLVVEVKAAADATPQNFRLTLDLSNCGGCKLKEYACTCGH